MKTGIGARSLVLERAPKGGLRPCARGDFAREGMKTPRARTADVAFEVGAGGRDAAAPVITRLAGYAFGESAEVVWRGHPPADRAIYLGNTCRTQRGGAMGARMRAIWRTRQISTKDR